MLVLLDACHSGAVTGDSSTLMSNADRLRSTIAASNVTVLTSATSDEFSREDDKWSNGTEEISEGRSATPEDHKSSTHHCLIIGVGERVLSV